eukprot:XP_001698454.1 predicted protein [Chlamydomonas reinhardtii]
MAHEQQLITKRAWLGPGGPEGYLTVASASLKWQPAASGATGVQELRIPLSCITNNQRAKDKPLVRITFTNGTGGAAAHVFQFESVADRDAALDVLTKVTSKCDVCVLLVSVVSSGEADLKALYDELAEVDGRHQRVLRVSLTPEQVAQIFAEQPAVLRAYREHVPHRMAEEDFWRRYDPEMELAAGSGGGGSGGHHHPLAADPDPDDLAAAINKHGEVVLQGVEALARGCAAEEALLEATPLARALAEEEAAGPGGAATASGPGGASALLRDPASSVPPETLAFLRRTVLSVNEACRHLWRCLPANTPARRDKAGRLARLLESKRGEAPDTRDHLPVPWYNDHFLCRPAMTEVLTA